MVSARRLAVLVSLAWMLGVGAPASRAADVAGLCRGVPDTGIRPLPAALAPKAARLFGLRTTTPEQLAQTTVVRCAGGRLLACYIGANLPCGKARLQRVLPEAKPWCGANPDADYVPAYISGHDSIYRWRCRGGEAVAIGEPEQVDPQGYLAQYWKVIP